MVRTGSDTHHSVHILAAGTQVYGLIWHKKAGKLHLVVYPKKGNNLQWAPSSSVILTATII